MSKEEINKDDVLVENIIDVFRKEYAEDIRNENHDEVTEITDDDIREIVHNYLSKPTLSEANSYWYDIIDARIKGSYDDVNWKLGSELASKTPEYKQWIRHNSVRSAWCSARYICKLENAFVEKNGKLRTDEEAAKLAASKWCELIFYFHIQDNGAMNESHGGGFPACALGTILANDSKEGISEDVKKKAYDLFVQYYIHYIHHMNNKYDLEDIIWANDTMPDPENTGDDKFDWRYGFSDFSMMCDYGPSTALWCLLVNAGVNSDDARNICPWKTSITIRTVDNAVFYNPYQGQIEL